MEIFVLLLLLFNSCLCIKNYRNYTLFRTVPVNAKHLDFVKNLSSQINVDFWRPPGLVNKPVDLLINPEDKEIFMRSMEENEFNYTTVIDDIQSAFDLQTMKHYVRSNIDTFDWKSYYKLNDIYAWLNDLQESYPNEVTILHLGKTYENRQILGVKLIMKGIKKRSAVVIEGGIHAREWITPAFVTYFLHKLVKSIDTPNSDIGKIVRTYEFYFIPVLNPDGYYHSMKVDRMWRKNRYEGYGVDLNRNFDIEFGTVGTSSRKTDQTYCGPYAFSEKESQAVRLLTNIVKDKLEYYLAFHSYGQYMIIPYTYTEKHLANYDEMYNILSRARQGIYDIYYTKYKIGTAYETVGVTASGVSGCWVKKTYRVPYVVTFELRDTGKYGFALPPSQILQTSAETTYAVLKILSPKNSNFSKLRVGSETDEQESLYCNVMFFNISMFIILRFYSYLFYY